MKTIAIETKLTVFENFEELPQQIQELAQKAIRVRNNAYAPYSKFNVGAAILLDNGEIAVGSNQENAAYPSGLCAERTAIFHAGAIYPNAKIEKMFITATSEVVEVLSPIPPCGACRQAIAEYEIRQESAIEIYFMGESGVIYKSDSLKNLLPFTFDKSFIK